MVKKMIVAVSALALVFGAVAVASAFSITGYLGTGVGDMIMIPMKITTSYEKKVVPGGFSTFFGTGGCDQYTHPLGFTPWGPWAGTACTMKVQISPPKCVSPGWCGPAALGGPPPLPPGACLVKSVEKYGIDSPGCEPCVVDGLKYEFVRTQVVK